MIGYLWFLFWQAVGILASEKLFSEKRQTIRLWLGGVTGSVLSMWAPVPFAFFLGFSIPAHLCAAVIGLAGAAALLLCRGKGMSRANAQEPSCAVDKPLLWIMIPSLLLWIYLVWSHTLRSVNGAMYTGQCTYGDMSMHLGFITSLAEQKSFPPHYSILPTAMISYPFLCDSVSASLYLLGTPLKLAYGFPMLFAYAQVTAGVWLLGTEICRQKIAPILASIFFFLNGGFGMIYYFKDYSLHDLFTGFYKTPTNLTEKGMRWVNVIADMLLPQRATLFGWAALTAALYLLFRAVFRNDTGCAFPAGVVGGLLPMIHTHSFFALGLTAACWMFWSAIRDRFSREWFSLWLKFGLTAVLLAIPQLWIWTFRSVNGNDSFLRLHFDWVNSGTENWFWFWLKNVGILFVTTPVAFLFGDKEQRAVFSGSILIFVLCELVVFQPNIYDNNKLLYIAYLFACFLSADWLTACLDRIPTRREKAALLCALLILASNAGVFTLIREVLSGVPRYGYELFSADEVSAADYIAQNTPTDATILTTDNHDNPVAVLTGRDIVCGSPSYLYFHGLDYTGRQAIQKRMLTDPAAFEQYKDQLDVDFVYMGYHETALADSIESYLAQKYPVVFSARGIQVFDVR